MNVPAEEKLAQVLVENEQLKEKLVCKRCGFDNKQDEYKVDEEIVKDYYKCMLAQEQYSKTYDIMNGAYTITCQEPTRKLLSAYVGCWDRLDHSVTQYAHDLMCLLMITRIERRTEEGIVSIFEMSSDEKLKLFRGAAFENIESVIPDTYQNLPQILLSAIKGVAQTFSALCTQIAEAALDENFWKGVGLN
jgi:CRISPR/Cas system CMR subunit Cmr6 (Cas7 group RAMP superfamily)